MLQIITGCFFKTEHRYQNDGNGILYTNLNFLLPLKTLVGALVSTKQHEHGIQGLVFTYNNQIEKMAPDKIYAGEVTRIGDDEIIDSFRCFATVGLGAYFNTDKLKVLNVCRNRKIKIPHIFQNQDYDARLHEAFPSFLKKSLSLSRQDFEVIDRCVRQFTYALEVSDTNIDLSYTMFVYCLEALSKNFGIDKKSWDDYDQNTKEKIEKSLKDLDPKKAEEIKEILLSASHNKLKQRFVEYVVHHLKDDYYLTSHALPKSDIKQALANLYKTRSGFAHELLPILDQLRHNFSEGDLLTWENQPYLTLNGVIRITRQVLVETIERLPILDTEDYDWRSNLPGVVKVRLAANHWVFIADQFNPNHETLRLSGYLEIIDEAIFLDKPLLNIDVVLEKIEQHVPTSSHQAKITMLTLYGLYAYFVNGDQIERRNSFFQKYFSLFKICGIVSMLLHFFFSTQITGKPLIGKIL